MSASLTISVLITYYNEGELLAECLRSLAQGDVLPHEVLIYDDASATPPEPYLISGLPIRVIRGATNRGPSVGRNALLREAAGEFVHFHDADDLFMPGWCAKVRERLERSGAEVVFTEVDSIRGTDVETKNLMRLEWIKKDEDLLNFCLRNPMLVPSGTYRRALVQSIGGYREALWQSEDFDFHVRVAARQPRYELLLEALVRVRIRPQSRSHNHAEVWASTAQAVQLLADEMDEKYRKPLAEVAATAGIRLYRLGQTKRAHDAFRLATRLGPPNYGREWFLYRFIARWIGPVAAENVSSFYRRIFPDAWRRRARRAGVSIGLGSDRDSFY